MKVCFPVFAKQSDPSGVTLFISVLLSHIVENSLDEIELYDNTGQIKEAFTQHNITAFQRFKRRVMTYINMHTFGKKVSEYDHVFLNPSMYIKSMLRDMKYAEHCQTHGVPYSIFMHGWDWDYFREIDNNPKIKASYSKSLANANVIFVLGQGFKNALIRWGVEEKRIICTKTMIEDSFFPEQAPKHDNSHLRILFLSRILKEKGIIETVDAFEQHQIKYPDTKLTIAGYGSFLDEVKAYVKQRGLENVTFTGYVGREAKIELLKTHNVFFLPSYTEGMPISVFEAMAYGQAIVTRSVGGIPDFFVQDKMGMMTESLEPADYADYLHQLEQNPQQLDEIAAYNREYISENILASKLCASMLDQAGIYPQRATVTADTTTDASR